MTKLEARTIQATLIARNFNWLIVIPKWGQGLRQMVIQTIICQAGESQIYVYMLISNI